MGDTDVGQTGVCQEGFLQEVMLEFMELWATPPIKCVPGPGVSVEGH